MFLYRRIFKQAWLIAWRYKFLWFFGFFAAVLGLSGNYEIVAQALDTVAGKSNLTLANLNSLWQQGLLQAFSLSNFKNLAVSEPLNFLLFLFTLFLVLIFVILLIWITVVSVGALIYSSKKLSKKEKCSFSEAWEAGINNFWQIFSIYLIAKIIILVLLFITSIPAYFLVQSPSLPNFILYYSVFVIMVALAIIISFLAIYASAYVVIKKQTVGRAITLGYKLFTKNWIISIETALLLLLFNILFGLAFALLLLLLSIPFTMLLFAFVYLTIKSGFIATTILGFILFFILIITFSAFWVAFQFIAWTILFLRLQRPARSKIERLAKTISGYLQK